MTAIAFFTILRYRVVFDVHSLQLKFVASYTHK
jgi:hypothetical protein